MNPTNNPQPARRRRFLSGIITGALVGILLAGGISAYAHFGGSPWGRGGGHGPCTTTSDTADVSMMGDRAGFVAGWVLSRLDATEEQEEQVKTILVDAMSELAPLRQQHCDNHQAMLTLLSQAEIDRNALSQLRQSTLGLADTASTRLVTAIADAADVLTPEQRSELVEMAQRFRH